MMALYPVAVAAHVAAVVFLVGGMFAHDRMLAAVARVPLHEQAVPLALLLRLDRQVVTPALLLTWTLGLALALWAGWFPSTWLLAKLAVVVALSALHGVQSGRVRRSLRDATPATAIAGSGVGIVLAMLTIAVLAIAKPI